MASSSQLPSTTPPTDVTAGPGPKSSKHKTGKQSKFNRTDAFRAAKNDETDAAIMAGIFARLKIKDPTSVASIPLSRDQHPVTVPVSFKTLPPYVNRIWDTMEAIGPRPFAALNNAQNKAIFTKGSLILSEVKVCCAQRAKLDKPDEDLPSRKLYTLEEINDYASMSSIVPVSLAIYLECIGNTTDRSQLVTPLLAVIQADDMQAASGALTFAPRQLLPLLRLLADGVPENEQVHQVALALMGLPKVEFVAFDGPIVAPRVEAQRMVRLSEASRNFWIENDQIKWSDAERQIFMKIVQSMSARRDFNVAMDITTGYGSKAQLVRTIGWRIDRCIEWYTATDISEYEQKLGAAFALCYSDDPPVQPSRFTCDYITAYWRGEITPRRVMSAILAGQE